MKLLGEYKKELGLLFGIVVLFFALRLPSLTLQPVFADEAIYIHWAQLAKVEASLRFISLTDGKTPLWMWVLIPFFKVFHDPLYAGRFLSVLSGLGTLLGVFAIGWKYFNLRAALWAAFLVVISPYLIFFDRIGLVDSMLAMFTIWAIFLALLVMEYKRFDLAMVLGYLIGGGMLTKTPGIVNIIMLPTTLTVFDFKSKNKKNNLLKVIVLWIIAAVVAELMYNILRLGPGFDNLNSRNGDYLFSPTKLLQSPTDPWLLRIPVVLDYGFRLLGLPTLLFVYGGIALAFLKKHRFAQTLFLWSFLPLVVEMCLLKTFTARYTLFSIPPLLVLGGWAIDSFLSQKEWLKKFSLEKPVAFILTLALILIWPLYVDMALLIKPENAPLPRSERSGYFEEWTAGYGLREMAQYFLSLPRNQLTVIGTEGIFGTLPDGLQIYFLDRPNIVFQGNKATISAQLRTAAKDHPTFFVKNVGRFDPNVTGVELLKEYPKATKPDGSHESMYLYRVFSEESTPSALIKQ